MKLMKIIHLYKDISKAKMCKNPKKTRGFKGLSTETMLAILLTGGIQSLVPYWGTCLPIPVSGGFLVF